MNDSWKTIGWHVLGWILFFGLVIGFTLSLDSFPARRFSEPFFLLFIAVYMGLFYINAYVLMPKFYFRQRRLLYVLGLFLLFAAVYWLKPYDRLLTTHRHSPREVRLPPLRQMPPADGHPFPPPTRLGGRPRQFDIVSVVLFLAVWSSSTAWQVNRRWRHTERRALQAERDKTSAELSFLKVPNCRS